MIVMVSPAGWTVTVAVLVAVPPWPSETVYSKLGLPTKPVSGV
ncbi:MAG: hypothetical protein WDN44_05220 [Sphingomonas sp.]